MAHKIPPVDPLSHYTNPTTARKRPASEVPGGISSHSSTLEEDAGVRRRKAASTVDPLLPTEVQMQAFKKIYSTLAEALESGAGAMGKLGMNKSYLEELKGQVEDVHPIYFLQLVVRDRALRENMRKIYHNHQQAYSLTLSAYSVFGGHPWKQTHEQFVIKMGHHKTQGSLDESVILAYCEKHHHETIRGHIKAETYKELLEFVVTLA
ncbi:MAG: hypothetical protein FJZ63_03385 [Chlamydiae bacterium]|nr:hypothetical protein [Chlamydiota bacterium]